MLDMWTGCLKKHLVSSSRLSLEASRYIFLKVRGQTKIGFLIYMHYILCFMFN